MTSKPPFKCYHKYAPLEHLNTTDKRTAKLAFISYPTGGDKTVKEDVLGMLLFNPRCPWFQRRRSIFHQAKSGLLGVEAVVNR